MSYFDEFNPEISFLFQEEKSKKCVGIGKFHIKIILSSFDLSGKFKMNTISMHINCEMLF